jgi:DNA-binding transcriptional LysR family regulator
MVEDAEIICSLIKTKSLSHSARQLNMSRPGLSNRINNLEARYGTKLFERTSQGVFPTEAGLMVSRFAHQVTNLHDDLTAALSLLRTSFADSSRE